MTPVQLSTKTQQDDQANILLCTTAVPGRPPLRLLRPDQQDMPPPGPSRGPQRHRHHRGLPPATKQESQSPDAR